jgi:hypothetical protein
LDLRCLVDAPPLQLLFWAAMDDMYHQWNRAGLDVSRSEVRDAMGFRGRMSSFWTGGGTFGDHTHIAYLVGLITVNRRNIPNHRILVSLILEGTVVRMCEDVWSSTRDRLGLLYMTEDAIEWILESLGRMTSVILPELRFQVEDDGLSLDRYGHRIGDQILECAALMTRSQS